MAAAAFHGDENGQMSQFGTKAEATVVIYCGIASTALLAFEQVTYVTSEQVETPRHHIFLLQDHCAERIMTSSPPLPPASVRWLQPEVERRRQSSSMSNPEINIL